MIYQTLWTRFVSLEDTNMKNDDEKMSNFKEMDCISGRHIHAEKLS